jgi:hypothetical protein
MFVTLSHLNNQNRKRPTAWRSADWPTLQDYIHYTYFTANEHPNKNTKPKANSAAAPGWAYSLSK